MVTIHYLGLKDPSHKSWKGLPVTKHLLYREKSGSLSVEKTAVAQWKVKQGQVLSDLYGKKKTLAEKQAEEQEKKKWSGVRHLQK